MEKRKTPHPTDTYVGQRIRSRRKDLKISQDSLGKKLGLTFQQIQKYEKGTNRVSASKLLIIAQELGVDVNYFFGDLGGEAKRVETQFQEGSRLIERGLEILKQEYKTSLTFRVLEKKDGFYRLFDNLEEACKYSKEIYGLIFVAEVMVGATGNAVIA